MGHYSLHRHSRRGFAEVYSRLYDGPHQHRRLHPGARGRILVHLAVVVPLGLRDVVGWRI